MTQKEDGDAVEGKMSLLKRKLRLDSVYFSQNTLMLSEPREGFDHLHSILKPRALRYLPLVKIC